MKIYGFRKFGLEVWQSKLMKGLEQTFLKMDRRVKPAYDGLFLVAKLSVTSKSSIAVKKSHWASYLPTVMRGIDPRIQLF
ncbi:MAG: hypothetical protein HN884_15135 [Rhodospirillaceae bacterium]|jgi:hypothetical protein|nr:hypothetical protein [Rhodospirillaceae bacterium]